MRFIMGNFESEAVVALLEHHHRTARAESPPCSAHALDLDGLRVPEIDFWSLWRDEALLAIGALKRLSGREGEIKSMHVVQAERRSGAGGRMLRHLIASAVEQNLTRLSLETGVQPYFEPAVALYRRHGFVECVPFADYVEGPHSMFLTLDLASGEG